MGNEQGGGDGYFNAQQHEAKCDAEKWSAPCSTFEDVWNGTPESFSAGGSGKPELHVGHS